MYCPNCGKEVKEEVSFCPYCGAQLVEKVGKSMPSQRTSGLAIASLVLGIIPVLGIGAILAIIFGVKAKNRIRIDPSLSGEGLALAGIILGIIHLALIPIMLAMLMPALTRAREQARRASCMNNLKQVGLACHMFAQDHSGKFPENPDNLFPEYLTSSNVLFCPSSSITIPKKITKDNATLCYEYVSGLTEEYDPGCLVMYDRIENHLEGRNIFFLDGHVQWTRKEKWDEIYQRHKELMEKAQQSSYY